MDDDATQVTSKDASTGEPYKVYDIVLVIDEVKIQDTVKPVKNEREYEYGWYKPVIH
jgi:hypothetical protein